MSYFFYMPLSVYTKYHLIAFVLILRMHNAHIICVSSRIGYLKYDDELLYISKNFWFKCVSLLLLLLLFFLSALHHSHWISWMIPFIFWLFLNELLPTAISKTSILWFELLWPDLFCFCFYFCILFFYLSCV